MSEGCATATATTTLPLLPRLGSKPPSLAPDGQSQAAKDSGKGHKQPEDQFQHATASASAKLSSLITPTQHPSNKQMINEMTKNLGQQLKLELGPIAADRLGQALGKEALGGLASGAAQVYTFLDALSHIGQATLEGSRQAENRALLSGFLNTTCAGLEDAQLSPNDAYFQSFQAQEQKNVMYQVASYKPGSHSSKLKSLMTKLENYDQGAKLGKKLLSSLTPQERVQVRQAVEKSLVQSDPRYANWSDKLAGFREKVLLQVR